MDKAKSLILEKELINKSLNGYEVVKLLNNGKSAAVFKARKNNKDYALKIFDNDLVERFGYEIQIKRIEQEIKLKNHTIENLVKIYEGGKTTVEDKEHFFIVMEFISGTNLKEYIDHNDYDQNFVLKVLTTLHSITKELLKEKNIVHRDIKPENIMISDQGDVILMDLGVLKLIGAKSFSDEEEKSFVGTLRYAAPEFLLRIEEDSVEGWESLNIYQIGATLHDLIMKKELFMGKVPYANLVIAIKEDNPVLSNPKYSYNLQQLVRDMLIKNWKKRIELVNDERIAKIVHEKNILENSYEDGIEKILKKRIKFQASFDEIEKLKRTNQEQKKTAETVGKELEDIIKGILKKIKKDKISNHISDYDSFLFSNDYCNTNEVIQNFSFGLSGDLKMGYPRQINLFIRIFNNSEKYVEINCMSFILPDNFTGKFFPSIHLYSKFDKESRLLNKTINRIGPVEINYAFETVSIFKGNAEFDESFVNEISFSIIAIIARTLEKVEEVVESRINEEKTTTISGLYLQDASKIKEMIVINS